MMIELGENPVLIDADFNNIQTKCLLTIGSRDNMVSIEETQNVAKSIPNSDFQIIEEFVHPIDKIDNGVLGKIIMNYINN